MALSKTRNSKYIPLVGNEEDHLSLSQLPLTREVLCFFFHLMRGKHDVRGAAVITIKEVIKRWNTTKVPQIKVSHATDKLVALYQDWRAIHKNLGYPNETDQAKKKKSDFQNKLDKLFDISLKNAEAFLEEMAKKAKDEKERKAWEEEKLFLLDQRSCRVGKIGGIDANMMAKEQKQLQREEKKLQDLLKMERRRMRDAEKRQRQGKTSLFLPS